ncbi:nitrilase-related carbon-nitrogen hydrolase [Pleionea sediminis]|uniref:nitrilase-related carbon-nitrogen hydrolase n=1 Tax=Pleionea sediminis TaxID=2569479 RepID=UPI001185B38E|nr:nitrilase-related carbon-nitrogen hydrolase [Pleionea sediminis]
MSELKFAVIQFSPKWEQPAINRKWLSDQIKTLKEVDVIVLPEMFASGFSLTSNCIESHKGETVVWMIEEAAKNNAVVCGSVKTQVDDSVFNRFYWAQPDGELLFYDKVHLFGAETRLIAPGAQRVFVEYLGFRIFLQTCYDLRFPVFCRNDVGYDIIINVASWPIPRIHHWNALLKARAIENLCYVVAANRVGKDGNEWEYNGESQIIAPDGELIEKAELDQSHICRATLKKSELIAVRDKFPFLEDRDDFSLTQITTQK